MESTRLSVAFPQESTFDIEGAYIKNISTHRPCIWQQHNIINWQ